MNRMKRPIMLLLVLLSAAGAAAQQSLAGRVYHNPNIMQKMIDEALSNKDVEAKFEQARDSVLNAARKEKGRELTADEKAKALEDFTKARKLMEGIKKGMSTTITVEFKSDKEMVMKMDMKMDEELLKAAGVPWAKRKLMKAAMAVMPAQKAQYERRGNLVICIDGNDRDTLTLSADGKELSGKMDEKTPFVLTRTK